MAKRMAKKLEPGHGTKSFSIEGSNKCICLAHTHSTPKILITLARLKTPYTHLYRCHTIDCQIIQKLNQGTEIYKFWYVILPTLSLVKVKPISCLASAGLAPCKWVINKTKGNYETSHLTTKQCHVTCGNCHFGVASDSIYVCIVCRASEK